MKILFAAFVLASTPVFSSNSDAAPSKRGRFLRSEPSFVQYNLEFEEGKKIVRFFNRFEDREVGTLIENTHIREWDVNKTVDLINKHDRLRSQLNEHFERGMVTSGALLKKRPQQMAHDIDPATPIGDDMGNTKAVNGTKGYTTDAILKFKGLQLGDTVRLYNDKGHNTPREEHFFVIKKENINSYGESTFTLPMGQDNTTSTYLGVQVDFGSDYGFTKWENGTVSYEIQILRTLEFSDGTSAKPISKRRAKRRT